MAKIKSREIRLVSRPKGIPSRENFSMAEVEVDGPAKGQALVENLFMSVDPYMRGRMNEGKSYTPPFEIGKPLGGGAVGRVIDSRADGFKPGDIVVSSHGWRERFVASAEELHLVSGKVQPLSVYLGTLGMTGMTAWVGLNLFDISEGEVLFVSGAAGAVGSVAGQLAKLRGCRVVGSVGSDAKVRFLLGECGFDAAFNYHTGSNLEHLKLAAPDGIDLYFDNAGGEALQAALATLRPNGRIIACGGISLYNAEQPQPGPSNLFAVVTKRLTIKGFIVSDWMDRQTDFETEVGALYAEGKLKHKETVVTGIDHAVDAFLGLFRGENIGKMVVKLA